MLTLFLESFDVSAKAFVDFQKAPSFRSILYMHDDILLVKTCEGFQKYPDKSPVCLELHNYNKDRE